MTRRQLALHLAMVPGIGGKTLVRILARNDLLNRSPDTFLSFSEESLREEYRLSEKVASAIKSLSRRRKEAGELEARLDGLGVSLITAVDAHYPEKIEQFDPDPPGILFLYGNLKLLSAKTFGILSSRDTSPEGLDKVESLAEAGILNGEVLVSGHDRPEYQRSAIVPLRWGAPRILVLDRGLFEALGENLSDEPFRAARLWRYQFDPKTDLVVTPFRPDSKFIGANNRVRDRLIASLSDRIEFIEVREGGNMAKLRTMAIQAGRA